MTQTVNRRVLIFNNYSVTKALWIIIWPSVLYALFFAFYNIADVIISVHFGKNNEINSSQLRIAVASAYPLYLFYYAFANLLVTGTTTNYSIAIGKKNEKEAVQISQTAFFINFTIVVLVGVILLLINKLVISSVLSLQHDKSQYIETIVKYAVHFNIIIVCGMPIYTFSLLMSSLLRAEGYTKISSVSGIISVLLNISLDFLLIIVFKLSLPGAAIATLISWFLQFFILLFFIYLKRHKLKNIIQALRLPRLNKFFFKKIFGVGISSFTRNFGVVMCNYFVLLNLSNLSVPHYINDLSSQYTELSALKSTYWASIYGVASQMTTFVFPPVFAILNSASTFIGYNYGAKNYLRIKKALKIIFLIFFTYLLIEVSTFIILAPYISRLFIDPSDQYYQFANTNLYQYSLNDAIKTFRLMYCGLFLSAVVFTSLTYYQATSKKIKAFIFNFMRSLVFCISAIFLCHLIAEKTGNTDWFWIYFVIADLSTCIICLPVFINDIKKINHNIIESTKNIEKL